MRLERFRIFRWWHDLGTATGVVACPGRRSRRLRPASSSQAGGLILALVCLIAGPHPIAAAAAETRNIVFFGDSLTAGYGLSEPSVDAYPALIQKKLDAAGLSYRAVNAGLSGETSAAGLRRVDWILRQPVSVFVLALGANDGLRGVSPSTTSANLQAIVDRVRAAYPDAKVVIAGMMMPQSMGPEYVRAFRDLYPALAEKNRGVLVPFLLEGVGGVRDMNQGDGIHPNARGHALVAENVWKVIQPLL